MCVKECVCGECVSVGACERGIETEGESVCVYVCVCVFVVCCV